MAAALFVELFSKNRLACNCFESRPSVLEEVVDDDQVHKLDIDVFGIESHWEKLWKLLLLLLEGWRLVEDEVRDELELLLDLFIKVG